MADSYLYDEVRLVEEACEAENIAEPSSVIPWVPPYISVDCTHLFTTEEVFATREDLLHWARDIARKNGYVLVITRSDSGNMGKLEYVNLGCERHGVYKPYKNPDDFKYKKTGTQKSACPFRLKGRPIKAKRGWVLKVMVGLHNHEPAKSLLGHSYAGRLSEQEKVVVTKMAKAWVAPRNMLLELKDKSEDNATTITQVYSFCKRFRKADRGPLTEMQHLMKKLTENNYVHYERNEDNSDVIRDVFWAHPDAVKLFNAFPQVAIMDCTYKTNKYRIPLLEIVGITSTDLTYSIAFCYMAHERTEDYIWALECMKSLIGDPANIPQVIVTDKDLALVSAVEQCLPTSSHLLCRFHINKNVEAKCALLVGKDYYADLVLEKWGELINAETVQKFEEDWQIMYAMCKNFPKFLTYISTTWLSHKEKFVKAWTNTVMHFGTTTTNRAEGAHSKLKMMLKDSKGDLCASWEAMHRLTILRHSEILASFERSITISEHRFKIRLYNNLRGFAATKALQLMHAEQKRMKSHDKVCGCLLKVTHGLPCACALASFDLIPYEAVHPFWKRLTWDEVPVADKNNGADLFPEFDNLIAHFHSLDDAGKNMVRRKVKEIYSAESSSLCTPPVKIQTKGKPKAKASKGQSIGSLKREPSYFEHVISAEVIDSNATPSSQAPPRPSKNKKSKDKSKDISRYYLDRLPSFFRKYIDQVVDVDGDGNCGYRAVAALLPHEKGQDGWPWVREELIRELEENLPFYAKMWSGVETVQNMLNRLTLNPGQFATADKWMHLPEMGYLIATRFQVVFISMSLNSSYTYLPLRSSIIPENQQIIAVGHVNNNHYVQLKLKPGHPMPHIALQWHRFSKGLAKSWIQPHSAPLERFTVEYFAWIDLKGGPSNWDYNEVVDITAD